ncbi:MAG: RtcB family protein [Candidatus Kariarchaeaceae archaeon]
MNCGVRTLVTPLTLDDIRPNLGELAENLFSAVPAGLGRGGDVRLTKSELDEVLINGAQFITKKGYGNKSDLTFCEEEGRIDGANPDFVSDKAKKRGIGQVGTLGSGNHYLEVQVVDQIFSEEGAKAFGLEKDQIIISIHCGSRALGHQVGTDYLEVLEAASRKYNIPIRERELVSAPINSREGEEYFAAVKCGINAAFTNRHVIGHLARTVFSETFGVGEEEIRTLYDVGHNNAKVEEHVIDGEKRELLILRKGSTRAFGPGYKEVPERYRSVGQPVLIGGTMATNSWILHGTEKAMELTFGSANHGAGRVMSRRGAIRQFRGQEVKERMRKKGIILKAHSLKGIAEEAPGAYKDVNSIVDIVQKTGISNKVANVLPVVVIKG